MAARGNQIRASRRGLRIPLRKVGELESGEKLNMHDERDSNDFDLPGIISFSYVRNEFLWYYLLRRSSMSLLGKDRRGCFFGRIWVENPATETSFA